MDPLNPDVNEVYRAFLVIFRTGTLMMTVPVFGHVSIPRMLRVWFVLLVSFLILPTTILVESQLPRTMPELTLVIFSELAIGFLMGFAVIIVFASVQFAGHMIGLQMGLAVANTADPIGAGQISIVSEFYYLFSLIIFLLVNGHHIALDALMTSFHLIPIGGAVFGGLDSFIADLTFMVFVSGIKLAAPVIITLFITNAVLGIVARTVPQMNVFIVGFPLAIGVGLAVIGVSFPFFYMLLNKLFMGLERDFAVIIRILSG